MMASKPVPSSTRQKHRDRNIDFRRRCKLAHLATGFCINARGTLLSETVFYAPGSLCPEAKAAQIYRKTGNLRAVQLLLGHIKLESTIRYLGIEVDDALSSSEQEPPNAGRGSR
jgi:hypothetical protein